MALKVTLQRGTTETMTKTYQADGVTQGGKMFWAGVFGMKNAIQQSTKDAVDKILAGMLMDLNALPTAGGAAAQ